MHKICEIRGGADPQVRTGPPGPVAGRQTSPCGIAFTRRLSLLLLFPALASAEPMVLVADTRRFSGLLAWWTNLYNESHFWFAALTIVTIPTLGLIMGKLTDLVMARIGINLKSRVLAEH